MRSYVKIFGPPVLKAIKSLEKVAVKMPQICIMHRGLVEGISPRIARDIGIRTAQERRSSPAVVDRFAANWISNYFSSSGIAISQERCDSIISKSGEMLGDYDFFFEWFEDPTSEQLNILIESIDEALGPLGCRYTLTSKE